MPFESGAVNEAVAIFSIGLGPDIGAQPIHHENGPLKQRCRACCASFSFMQYPEAGTAPQ
jgi:hypothetical protein